MVNHRFIAPLAAAAMTLSTSAASAAVVVYDFYGTVTSGNTPTYDPRFAVGGKVNFEVSWNSNSAYQFGNTSYMIAPMLISASVGGNAFNLGTDIFDGATFYSEKFKTGGSTKTNSFAAPLVIFDSTGVKGLMIYSDGGYGSPGLSGGSSVSGQDVCSRPNAATAYVCSGNGNLSLSTVAQLNSGLYGNPYRNSYQLAMNFGSFAGPGPIPEPGVWTMMLLGFGGLGAVLRHRRARAALAVT